MAKANSVVLPHALSPQLSKELIATAGLLSGAPSTTLSSSSAIGASLASALSSSSSARASLK